MVDGAHVEHSVTCGVCSVCSVGSGEAHTHHDVLADTVHTTVLQLKHHSQQPVDNTYIIGFSRATDFSYIANLLSLSNTVWRETR